MTTQEEKPIVLIVDDVPVNIKILADTLRREYRIKVSSNGADALERAQLQPQPDLILLDVMMPDLDGYEVCRRLKSNPATRSIPVIFVTAKSSEADQELGFKLGGVDYITKPFSIPIVKARVHTHVLLKRQADALERLSHIDPLTGIANRRQFDSALNIEWKRAVREGKPLSILMIDIDHFKDYNDHYGHGAGDECLRWVAATLEQGISRPGDLVARYGGEEFVVILPMTGSTSAYQLAERLRESILELKLSCDFSNTESVVSVSIGCATAETFAETDSPYHLLEKADQMLYCSKAKGRNRTSS